MPGARLLLSFFLFRAPQRLVELVLTYLFSCSEALKREASCLCIPHLLCARHCVNHGNVRWAWPFVLVRGSISQRIGQIVNDGWQVRGKVAGADLVKGRPGRGHSSWVLSRQGVGEGCPGGRDCHIPGEVKSWRFTREGGRSWTLQGPGDHREEYCFHSQSTGEPWQV